MTDITELAQSLKAEDISSERMEWLKKLADMEYCANNPGHWLMNLKETNYLASLALQCLESNSTLVEALEKAQQAPSMPLGLHPDTQKLVADFCTAIAEKLYKAQLKYGYDTDWKQDGWPSQCQAHFHQHIAKGDPRDVAAYCAFMWWHGWSTKPDEGLEFRTVTVKLPDYRNTYKSPLADEVEHQVRLALELFSSAAGIKVEAE
ncbi:hypothetical protein [Klebsiella quasipneumoniae]|uniref:hypothetical protein n=1 Tax=Klebsiella quasipneumoniae TaxID=1463165 RepID=UPI00287B717E|nr:hypothetical protein [Klebsiella quasipneumoniae]